MPLRTEVVDLEAEQARLQEQMDEVAEKQLRWQDSDPEQAQQLLVRGNELNNQANILDILAEEWDVESVELAGLTAGEVNRVEDTVESNPGVRERDAWVAIGTRDAPYLEHNPDAVKQSEYEDTVTNVVDLPLSYVRWAEQKISELSHLSEATGNGYLKLVREKQAAASTESEPTNG